MSEPIAFQVTRYGCPYCSFRDAKRDRTVKHIERCVHNPAARGCGTCAYRETRWPKVCAAGVSLTYVGANQLTGVAFYDPISSCAKWEEIHVSG